MKHMLAVIVVVLLASSGTLSAQVDPSVLDAQNERIETMARVSPTVLAIFSPGGGGGGSGVVISADGYALSNYHVTAGAGPAMKCGMADGKLYDAVIVGIDPTGDVALLKLLGRDDFPYAELGDSDEVRAGDWVFAMGNPFLLAIDFQPTVTYGIVSGVHRYQYPSGTLLEYADCIQIDASINPGNSGGPLFNDHGELIGINGRGSFEKRGRVNVGAAYAISINQIRNFLGHLRSGRVVDHATLGAVVATDESDQVVVTEIQRDSDSFRRGLRYGDEIVHLAGRPIHTVNALKNVLGVLPKGWRVPLSFRRNGQRHDILVRLRGAHGTGELWEKVSRRRQPRRQRPPRRDGKKPDDEQPEDQKRRRDPRRSGPPMSEIVKQHYEARIGYANYYFNRLERDRVWRAVSEGGDFSTLRGTWTLRGQDAGGAAVEFRLEEHRASMVFPTGETTVSLTEDWSHAVEPIGSGGLLTALSLWRRLLVFGPEQFGDVVYLGTVSLPGHEELADVLVCLHAAVECRFLVDPITGRLLALEMIPVEGADPCEVYFEGYEEFEGRFLPRHIEVRHGDAEFGVFELHEFALDEGEAK